MSGPNVGYATLQIIPSTKGFASALETDTRGASGAAGRKSGKEFAGGFLPSMKGIGGALAGVFAVTKGVDFLKGSISEASDLNEAGTKLQQVFGKATGDVLKFGAAGAKGLGQSNLAVQNAAALFGVYGRSAGLAGKANADFSTNLVQLSTDLASFYNTNPEDAAQAIAAGLRGESEPLRAYGVLLDANTVKAQALKMGLIKTTKDALTPQAKVLATQALIMKQTSVAQGDFARTSGGLANQTRIFSAQVSNLKGRIGAALLPAAVAATKGLNGLFDVVDSKIVPGFRALYDLLVKGDFTGTFAKVFHVEEDSPVVGFLLNLRRAVLDLIPHLQHAWGVVRQFAATMAAQLGPRLVQVAGLFQTQILPALGRLWQTIQGQVIPAIQSIVAWVGANLLPLLFEWWNILATQIYPIIAKVAGFIVGTLVPAVVKIVLAVGQRLRPVFEAVAKVIRQDVLPMVKSAAQHFQEWWPTISKVISFVVTLIGWVLKLAATILGVVLPPLISLVGWLLKHVVGAIIAVVGWIIKLIGWAIQIGGSFSGIGEKVSGIFDTVSDTFGSVVDFVTSLPAKITAAAKGMWDGLGNGLKAVVNGIIEVWNAIDFSIDVEVPGWVPHFGGKGFHSGDIFPDVKALATGGIVQQRRGGTLALIGEGREDEAVIPLSKLAAMLPDQAQGGTSASGDRPLVGSLTLQSSGNAHRDLDEVEFRLRKYRRGGRR